MTTTPTLAEMDREQLKAFVRERGWDSEIDLRKSTEEIRELCAAKVSTADTVPPAPLTADDASGDGTADDTAEAEGAPQDGAQAPVKTDADDEADEASHATLPLVKLPVQHFRVERFARWVKEGVVYQLRAGSFVSTMSHPVDELRAQGVPLVEVESVDDSDPGLGHRFA